MICLFTSVHPSGQNLSWWIFLSFCIFKTVFIKTVFFISESHENKNCLTRILKQKWKFWHLESVLDTITKWCTCQTVGVCALCLCVTVIINLIRASFSSSGWKTETKTKKQTVQQLNICRECESFVEAKINNFRKKAAHGAKFSVIIVAEKKPICPICEIIISSSWVSGLLSVSCSTLRALFQLAAASVSMWDGLNSGQ